VTGYAPQTLFFLILLSPILLGFSLLMWVVAQAFGLFRPKVPVFLNFLLVASFSSGALSLYASFETLWLFPSSLQRESLGQVVVGPHRLRQVDAQPHIMDPSAEWRYALDASTAADLRRRCPKDLAGSAPSHSCYVYSRQGERELFSITLSSEDQLTLSWRLW
jgi:hypothetical protein